MFRRDERGVSTVEFALVLPIAALTLVCEFTLGEALAISRKVAITGRTLTDLIARRPSLTESELNTILNASAQLAAPYSTANMTIVVAALATNASGQTTVTWSRSRNGTALTTGSTFTPPTGVARASTTLIYGSVRYSYTPGFAIRLLPSYPITFAFYVNPRVTSSIPLTN
ncbi:TadE/TadG family type IV pilus assembly protein [Methylosinus sp. Sm6]|uniref:TadE/TadG family type IV pilus assembly protein n=1 Tax=Methylosinus sp. Sm6 TaxID=2866948 RepID=UPI001C9979E9|nr:TadE/TadG family type IV pilus assembly protein [Methylosinus sp. Sm6]MBY6239865.1 pilus assembly protein [Methylosinus sp. Sm6]